MHSYECQRGGMADAVDSKSTGNNLVGSTPTAGTNFFSPENGLPSAGSTHLRSATPWQARWHVTVLPLRFSTGSNIPVQL